MASVTYAVTGMTCEHCSRAVSAELESLVGVSDVRVDLVPDGRSSVLVVSDAPLAVQATMENARVSLGQGWHDAYAKIQSTQKMLYNTEDAKEGVQSFVERRTAKFVGR